MTEQFVNRADRMHPGGEGGFGEVQYIVKSNIDAIVEETLAKKQRVLWSIQPVILGLAMVILIEIGLLLL